MDYSEPFYLFDSSGIWIAFCLGVNLFDVNAVWRGWFPQSDLEAVFTPTGFYLGTVVGNRFYYYDAMKHLRVNRYPAYPAIPPLPHNPRHVDSRKPPTGASDVETLKFAYGSARL